VQKRPTLNDTQLAKFIGELGKIGGNVNQIAHAINAGKVPPSADLVRGVNGAREELLGIADQVREALSQRGGKHG